VDGENKCATGDDAGIAWDKGRLVRSAEPAGVIRVPRVRPKEAGAGEGGDESIAVGELSTLRPLSLNGCQRTAGR